MNGNWKGGYVEDDNQRLGYQTVSKYLTSQHMDGEDTDR